MHILLIFVSKLYPLNLLFILIKIYLFARMFHIIKRKRGTDNILLSLDNHFETMSPISLLLTTKQPYQSYDLKMTHVKCPISLTTFARPLRDGSLEFQTSFMVEARQGKCGFRARGRRKKKKKKKWRATRPMRTRRPQLLDAAF